MASRNALVSDFRQIIRSVEEDRINLGLPALKLRKAGVCRNNCVDCGEHTPRSSQQASPLSLHFSPDKPVGGAPSSITY